MPGQPSNTDRKGSEKAVMSRHRTTEGVHTIQN